MDNKYIITIARQFGSGGHEIGKALAEKLSIPFYDKELVDQIAMESGFAPKFVEEHGEHAPGKSRLAYAFANQGVPGIMNGLSTADFLWNIQCNVILQLADKGPCVIVGRCADWVLEKDYDVLRVFVCGPLEARCKRAVEEYGDKPEDIQKTVKNIDKQRTRYCQHYCDKAWEDAENYDLCLNSGTISLDNCVAIVKSAYQELAK